MPRQLNHRNTKLRRLLGLRPEEKVPTLTLFANVEDEGTGDARELFVFRKVSGAIGEIRIDRAEAHFDPQAVARKITSKNGILPLNIDDAVKEIKKALESDPREYWKEVRSEGWRRDFRSFVHNGHVFGRSRVGDVWLKPPAAKSGRTFRLARRGNLRTWCKLLRIAQHSSRMRLGICAAFAAPLLHVIDLQSFMLVIAGRSKAGKSTVLLALGSIIGIGREGGLPNFNATGASLQEVAAEFNDLALPVNEIGLLGGAKRDAYQSLRSLIYRYAEGRDTSRHSKSTYATASGAAAWRGIMIASSENTIEALAELAGEKRDEGEYARAFDVPAVRDNNPTVFDSFLRLTLPQHREIWARQQLAEIREICSANHGLAFHRYATSLVEHRASLKDDTRRAMEDFLRELNGEDFSGALQHAAQNFALLYAGAAMAKRAGLLPWSLKKTRVALRTCFIDGVQEIAKTADTEKRALKTMLKCLHKLGPITKATNMKEVDGWYKESSRGRIYIVRTTRLRSWLSDLPEQERAVLRWLYEKQLLILADGKKNDLPKVEWAMKSYHHQRGGSSSQERCYQFHDPFPIIDQKDLILSEN